MIDSSTGETVLASHTCEYQMCSQEVINVISPPLPSPSTPLHRAVKIQGPNHWTARNFPAKFIFIYDNIGLKKKKKPNVKVIFKDDQRSDQIACLPDRADYFIVVALNTFYSTRKN